MRKIIKDMKFRRRREAKTDYKSRLAIVSGGLDRIVIRKTSRTLVSQVSRYSEKGDVTLAQANSSELAAFKWPARSNRPTAYLLGLLLAKKIKADGKFKDGEFVLDIGLSAPVKNSIPFVFAKGCVDGGMNLRNGIKIEENVYNCSDSKYAKELKEKDPEKYQKQYSEYIKAGVDATALGSIFKQAKELILNAR
jgi:large subunit ribosomal protein L18